MLHRLARRYPDPIRDHQEGDIERIAFHVERVFEPGARIADLGGGIGLFSPACAALGLEVWLVDDFAEEVNRRIGLDSIGLHQELGVHVVKADVRDWVGTFEAGSLDVITSFLSVEHWRHPPRPILQDAVRLLKPGGLLMMAFSNAFSLRRRFVHTFGIDRRAEFEEWYRSDPFRGIVRRPSAGDLRCIAQDLGLGEIRIYGRNWSLPCDSVPALPPPIDSALRRFFPGLCTYIYLEARTTAPPASIPR